MGCWHGRKVGWGWRASRVRGRARLAWLVAQALLGAWLMLAGPAAAVAQPLDAMCPTRPLSLLQPDVPSLADVCFVQDDQRALGPGDVLSGRWPVQRRDADQLVFTHTRAAYWVYVPLRNPDPVDHTWFLQLDYPLLDEVDFWVYDLEPAGAAPVLLHAERMGDARPFGLRPVRHRLFLLPLDFRPGQSLGVVIRVRSSGAINIPLSLHTAESALAGTQNHSLAQGMFLGALGLLIIFNLTLFLRLRILQPLYNAAYILCAGLFLASMSGLSFQYLWPDSPWLANVSVPVTEVLAILSLLLFTRVFLGVRADRWPRHTQLIRGLFAAGAVLFAASFWAPYSVIIKVNTVYALASMLCMFAIGIRHARQGERAARWYVASWLVFYAGFLFYSLAAFGYVPGFMAQERWMQAGLGSQIFLLTYAEIMQLRDLLDRALRIESSARSSLQHEVQARTADLRTAMGSLEQANRQLRELTRHDPLTGLLNRRGLDESLDRVLEGPDWVEPHVVLAIFDLDRFKRVNDDYGHDVGDFVLEWVAEVLRNLLRRKSDVLARFGGEEFVVLLPGMAAQDAAVLIQRVLDHVRRHPVDLDDGRQLPLTLSAGVAAWRPGDTAQSLFRRADASLYRAKNAGRDRLVIDSDQDGLADAGEEISRDSA
ncbi:sensor domain-containing diguanylate cyclase [Castellaniella sp.]|uniref:sensor domain-containing diguanylate cyclase n=1 Tax=Castellaniella sp. TaxID=1955812 RepID=UPI003C755406